MNLIPEDFSPSKQTTHTHNIIMSIELAVIKGVSVVQDDKGRVTWRCGGAIDADGANGQNGNRFSYGVDAKGKDKGLDFNANAGWPHGGWRNVLLDHGDGTPTSDGNGNWYSSTTYAWPGRPITTRYVDSTTVPYIVVNPIVRNKATGIVIGCRARVTYQGKAIDAVVADVSGSGDIGELSIAAAKALGFTAKECDPRKGGVSSGVSYECWPGTAATVNTETYLLQHA
jgi:hypothetical protein